MSDLWVFFYCLCSRHYRSWLTLPNADVSNFLSFRAVIIVSTSRKRSVHSDVVLFVNKCKRPSFDYLSEYGLLSLHSYRWVVLWMQSPWKNDQIMEMLNRFLTCFNCSKVMWSYHSTRSNLHLSQFYPFHQLLCLISWEQKAESNSESIMTSLSYFWTL